MRCVSAPYHPPRERLLTVAHCRAPSRHTQIFVVVARGLMEMLKNYYILRAADVCSLASVLCKLLRSGTFGACVDPTVRKDSAVRGRLLEMGYELLIMLVGYQSQLKRMPCIPSLR
mgnify:CR=1 FL=1